MNNNNKWTLALTALGLVSLTTQVRAQTTNVIATAVSATTISGYVDTSAVWNPGTGNANPAPYGLNKGKQDGFNVDSVDLRIEKQLDESQWSAGYVAELMFGPDGSAITGGTAAGFPEYIRQAYVQVRVPVGNGLDFQIGRFDGLTGYESSDTYKNPNWTFSYGKTLEPTENTGIVGTYKFCESFTAQLGVADTLTTSAINARTTAPGVIGGPEGQKALIDLLSFTAPETWGFLKGSTLYFGADWGQGPAGGAPRRVQTYVGGTMRTPIKDLTLGGSYDYVAHEDYLGVDTGHAYAIAGYISYKLTDKLTLNGRAEVAEGRYFAEVGDGPLAVLPVGEEQIFALTGTVQYDLWQNVITRLEIRWDDAVDGGYSPTPFGGTTPGVGAKKNEVMLAANIIYKF